MASQSRKDVPRPFLKVDLIQHLIPSLRLLREANEGLTFAPNSYLERFRIACMVTSETLLCDISLSSSNPCTKTNHSSEVCCSTMRNFWISLTSRS